MKLDIHHLSHMSITT